MSTNRKLYKFVMICCCAVYIISTLIKALGKKRRRATFAYKFNQMHCFMNSFEALLSIHFKSRDYKGDREGIPHTAISRKVVAKNVHVTIPKGNMGYDQYTVPDDCSCQTYFCCFPLALADTFPWPFVQILSNFFEKKENSKPPTTPFRIVACTFSDNLSRNSYIHPIP